MKIARKVTYKIAKNEALKYKTRTEFRINSYVIYKYSQRKKWMNKICKHMIMANHSTPQLILNYILCKILKIKSIYNDRTILKPYEVDIFFKDLNIGFEYNGKQWHKEDSLSKERDIKKKKLAKQKNITLFTMNEKSGLYENYEEEIKKFIIKHLDKINSIANKNITKEEILNIKINISKILTDLNDIIKIAKRYIDFAKFKKEQPKYYLKLKRLKLLKKYTSHMKRIGWTIDKIRTEISKYITLKEFRENSVNCYAHLVRNNKLRLLKNLKRDNKKEWTMKLIIKEISKYTTLAELRKNSEYCCKYIKKHKRWDLLSNLKKRFIHTEKSLIEEISKYTDLKSFREKSNSYYRYALRSKKNYLFDHLTRELIYWDTEMIIKEINKYVYLSEFIENSPKAYDYISRHNKHSLLESLKRKIITKKQIITQII